MNMIYQAAIHTPWWVYVLLVVLIQIGFKAAHSGVVPLLKLFIAPVIFGVMAIETLLNNLSMSGFVATTFLISTLIGVSIGWLQVARQQLAFDRDHHLIKVPGTWSVLVIILIIFATKYYFGYTLAIDPNAIKNTTFDIAFIGVTAICTGIFIGKLCCYLKRMYTEPSVDLKTNSM